MIVTEQEFNGMWKEINGMTFTPLANLIVEEKENDGTKEKIFKYEILKTSDEVYQDYLENKDKPVEKKPSENEVLMSNVILENAQLKTGLQEQQELTANLLLQIAELKGGNTNV